VALWTAVLHLRIADRPHCLSDVCNAHSAPASLRQLEVEGCDDAGVCCSVQDAMRGLALRSQWSGRADEIPTTWVRIVFVSRLRFTLMP